MAEQSTQCIALGAAAFGKDREGVSSGRDMVGDAEGGSDAEAHRSDEVNHPSQLL